ncbi:MAG: lysophospholipid acyltransferase family protein [Planctomycetes bacterium]|nr:lysophospholipid acyltransferase family protein [Planctomycetota bacterium]
MSGREQRIERAAGRRQLAAERAAAASRDAGWRRRWRMLRRGVGKRLLDWLGPLLLRLLARTWRVQHRGAAGLQAMQGEAPLVIVLWHGRMLAAMPIRPHKGRGHAVLVSPSDDGALVTRALAKFGYRVVRGSASRGGARALRDLAAALDGGASIVLTPDGPRGPRHTMNSGGAWLARDGGRPIVTLAIAVDRAWRLRSWDRFTIPKPFARLVVTYGAPRQVPRGCSDDDLEGIAAEVRDELLGAERDGFAALGVAADL